MELISSKCLLIKASMSMLLTGEDSVQVKAKEARSAMTSTRTNGLSSKLLSRMVSMGPMYLNLLLEYLLEDL